MVVLRAAGFLALVVFAREVAAFAVVFLAAVRTAGFLVVVFLVAMRI